MKKQLTILSLIFTTFALNAMEFAAEGTHVFGPEDAYPKEKAEEIYSRRLGKKVKIKEAPDYVGPDSGGEDTFVADGKDITTDVVPE